MAVAPFVVVLNLAVNAAKQFHWDKIHSKTQSF
jgi:hypothetical protein